MRDSDTTFKVKGQGHQATLLSAALTRKAAAAVSVVVVGKYCYVASARRRSRRLDTNGGGEEQGILCRHAHSLLTNDIVDYIIMIMFIRICDEKRQNLAAYTANFVITINA